MAAVIEMKPGLPDVFKNNGPHEHVGQIVSVDGGDAVVKAETGEIMLATMPTYIYFSNPVPGKFVVIQQAYNRDRGEYWTISEMA